MKDMTLTDVLATAIGREQEAFRFYSDLLERAGDPATRQAIAFMAEEEKKHEAFLVDYRNGRLDEGALAMHTIIAYKVAEYLEEPTLSKSMASHEVFLVAAHREQRSHRFYSELARLHPDGAIHDTLMKMANEELKHKEKVEYLYANAAFPQTDGG